MSKIDEVLKLKELLDSGLISQSDFDKLKKKIFGEPQVASTLHNKINDSEIKENVQIIKENKTSELNTFTKPLKDSNNTKYNIIGLFVFVLIFVAIIYYNDNQKSSKNIEEIKEIIDSTVPVVKEAPALEGQENYVDTLYTNNDSVSNESLSIGMDYEGGKIAYIFNSNDNGFIEGEIHGIILADDKLFSEWGCPNETIGNTFSYIGTGRENTKNIVDNCNTNSAAKICLSLYSGGYSDWFLPSKDELTKVYSNIDQLGGYPSGSYGVWSSTEYDEINSYVMSFDGNGNWVTLRKSHGFYIKAIRYF